MANVRAERLVGWPATTWSHVGGGQPGIARLGLCTPSRDGAELDLPAATSSPETYRTPQGLAEVLTDLQQQGGFADSLARR